MNGFALLLPGFSSEAPRFSKLKSALAEIGIELVIPDVPYLKKHKDCVSGFSKMLGNLSEISKSLSSKGTVFLIASSFGALVGGTLVAKEPTLFSAAVFWNPVVNPKGMSFWGGDWKRGEDGIFRNTHDNSGEEIGMTEEFLSSVLGANLTSLGKEIEIPVLVIQAKRDKTVSPTESREFFESLRSERKEFFPVESGHSWKDERDRKIPQVETAVIERTVWWVSEI